MRKTSPPPSARPHRRAARLMLRIGLAGWAAFSGLNAQAASLDDVAATWTGKGMSGVPIRLTLVKGVQPPPGGIGS